MLTTSERRGLSLLVLVFALGAARDLWRGYQLDRGIPGPAMPVAGREEGVPGRWPALESPAGPEALPDPATRDGLALDLNRATAEDLDRLPGIGPVLSARIVDHRARHGPFRQVEELLAVPGIGPRLLERLRERVRIGAPVPAPNGAGTQAPPAGQNDASPAR